MDLTTQTRLQELFRRENRSFLQFMKDAQPWASTKDREIVTRIREIATAEAETIDELGDYFAEQRIALPHLGAYPTSYSSYHFVHVRTVLPQLIREQKQLVDLLEKDLPYLQNSARGLAERLLEAKRKHLSEMQALQS